MNKIMDKVNLAGLKIKLELNRLLNEERGDIGIKQLAMTVGVIIIIGVVITVLTTKMDTFVEDVWKMLTDQLKNLTSGH